MKRILVTGSTGFIGKSLVNNLLKNKRKVFAIIRKSNKNIKSSSEIRKKNKNFYHRIHSLVMSADSAEHLSKKRQDVYNMMKKSYSWFINNGFQNEVRIDTNMDPELTSTWFQNGSKTHNRNGFP